MVEKAGFFSKSELATRYGLASKTIDDYVMLDLLQPITLADGVWFTIRCCLRLETIAVGKRFGFSLEEIRRLMAGG